MKKTTASLLLAFLSASAAAFADNPPAMSHDMHAGMDHGMMMPKAMSPEERQRRLDEKFAAMDADKNGSISRAEFDNHHRMMWEKHERKVKAMEEGKADVETETHQH